jgi:pyruvate,orthophosphate dikinase
MVFGNHSNQSATGVAFSRDPSSGARRLFGEFLRQAQGEDIVSGMITPKPLAARDGADSMEQLLPKQYAELGALVARLERHYKDLQDVEFTVEDGILWLLQTRPGKRSAQAAIQLVVDLAEEGLISKSEALLRVDPLSLDQILHPTIDNDAEVDIFARGLPASPGAVSGEIVLDPEEAERLAKRGRRVILVRRETNPEDIRGMHAAVGILTTRGGMTSHAAVVARGMGRPCVSGAAMIRIDPESGQIRAQGRLLNNHDMITIDGATGRVMVGTVPLSQPTLSGAFKSLMDWSDEFKRMQVRVNVETAEDALHARRFGAEGIGLCRTEHFFTGEPRIGYFRKLILATTDEDREEAISQLLPLQRADYEAVFRAMAGKPVTMRLLDPPLHSFLPTDEEEITDLAATLEMAEADLADRISALQEANPMLGHRGCRLLITAPHITNMQLRALFEAVVSVSRSEAHQVIPEILVPFVGYAHEFERIHQMINDVAETVAAETGFDLKYLTGPMIELPRAALISDRLAVNADFFSFGTNDLTQTVLGIARDDAASFFGDYLRDGVIESDPFVTIDRKGVGAVILQSSLSGRTTKPTLMLAICGEHGADPDTVMFCEEIGLDFISCSPFRVPIARLSAAQATLRMQESDPVW